MHRRACASASPAPHTQQLGPEPGGDRSVPLPCTKPDPPRHVALAGLWNSTKMSAGKRPTRPRPVDIMAVPMSDEEEADDPPARRPRGAPPPPSSTISAPTAFGLTATLRAHTDAALLTDFRPIIFSCSFSTSLSVGISYFVSVVVSRKSAEEPRSRNCGRGACMSGRLASCLGAHGSVRRGGESCDAHGLRRQRER